MNQSLSFLKKATSIGQEFREEIEDIKATTEEADFKTIEDLKQTEELTQEKEAVLRVVNGIIKQLTVQTRKTMKTQRRQRNRRMNRTIWGCSKKEEDTSDSEFDIFFVSGGSKSHKSIIDTGASRSIISERDLNQWLKGMPEKNRRQIQEENIDRICGSFKFGTGKAIKAKRVVNLPVMRKTRKFKLKLSVREDNVLFLIGMEAIKKLGMIIDP